MSRLELRYHTGNWPMKMNCENDCSSIYFKQVFFSLLKFFHFYLSDFHHLCKVDLIYFQIWHQLSWELLLPGHIHVSTSWEVHWLFTCRWKTWIWGWSSWQLIIFRKCRIRCHFSCIIRREGNNLHISGWFFLKFHKQIFNDFFLTMNYIVKTITSMRPF